MGHAWLTVHWYQKTTAKKRKMHTKSDNLQIVIGSNTDEILQKLLDALLDRY